MWFILQDCIFVLCINLISDDDLKTPHSRVVVNRLSNAEDKSEILVENSLDTFNIHLVGDRFCGGQ